MKQSQGHAISLKPSEAVGKQSLDTKNEKLLSSLPELGITQFMADYYQPPAENDAYLEIHSVPVVWGSVVKQLLLGHVFLMAYQVAKADELLTELLTTRENACAACFRRGDDVSQYFLDSRPRFHPLYICNQYRWHFPTWDSDIKMRMQNLARSCGVSGRQLLIVYSTKAILDDDVPVGGYGKPLAKIVSEWDDYLKQEKTLISEKISLV